MTETLICAAGHLPNAQWIKQQKARLIVAADGAADLLHALDIHPQRIIGDMDSLNGSFNQNTSIEQIACQQTTDFEKVLTSLSKQELTGAICLGLLGKDMDHTLYNLRVFSKFSPQNGLRLYHVEPQMAVGQWGFAINSSVSLNVTRGANFSLIPIQLSKVSTEGLKWPLSATILEPWQSSSTRNQCTSDTVHVHVHHGLLLCLVSQNQPIYPVSLKGAGESTA